MLEENNLIDKLEDQLIDHPDASTQKELNESSLDETFQKKLNARAEQIANQHGVQTGDFGDNSEGRRGSTNYGNGAGGYSFLALKTCLDYKHDDFMALLKELTEWFAFNDFAVLGELSHLLDIFSQRLADNDSDVAGNVKELLVTETIGSLKSAKVTDSAIVTDSTEFLLYYAFGEYSGCADVDSQTGNIIANNKHLIDLKLHVPVIDLLHSFMTTRIQQDVNDDRTPEIKNVSETDGANFFRLLTLLYFMLNVTIDSHESRYQDTLSQSLKDSDILSKVIEFIEHWKWYPTTHYRVRYLLMLVWKLLLVEFGDSDHLKAVDSFLLQLHKVENKDLKETALKCSPLDYFTFREDLKDKYPLYKDSEHTAVSDPFDLTTLRQGLFNAFEQPSVKPELKAEKGLIEADYNYFMAINNFSNSLSNLLENPRPNKSHTILSQLPAQTVHIATPVPSPPSTPSDFMSGGEKIRKLYHVNQGMPLIYPNTGEVEIPFAIQEANNILKNAVYESYSLKKLRNERHRFMIQERGNITEYDTQDTDEFTYDTKLLGRYPEKAKEINSLLRVELFYKTNLPRLSSLVQILIETIKSNQYDYNLNFPEWELNSDTSYVKRANDGNSNADQSRDKIEFILMQQLEVIKIKEITLKATTNIILLLLKWFKVSHIVKHYYLTSILFDQQYFNVLIDFLGKSFNNTDLQEMKGKADSEVNGTAWSDYETIITQNKLMNPEIDIPKFDFFHNCLKLKTTEDHVYELINKTPVSKLPSTIGPDNVNYITITKYNKNYCNIIVNLMNIANKVLIKGITQRIFIMNETKPSEFFKILLLNYDNEHLRTPILKILKKLIPYQGRKWKSVNMDLISLIYMHLKLSLKDNWLSGKDLENDFNNSFDQEIALRSLLQFYNIRKYPSEMEDLGYQVNSEEIPVLDLNSDSWY